MRQVIVQSSVALRCFTKVARIIDFLTRKTTCTRSRPYRNFSPFSAFVDPLRRLKTPPCDERVSLLLLREVSSWMGGGSLLLQLTILFRLPRKKRKKKGNAKTANKGAHRGLERGARAQRRPSELDYEIKPRNSNSSSTSSSGGGENT